MIRPERLQVAVAPGPEGRSIEGVIRQLIFQGASARLQLELADGTDVVTYVDPDDDLPFLRPGTSVYATWSPGVAYLLPGWPMQPGASGTDVNQIEATL
jgi:spermidine/putrescine transport system ATP-binding protein